MNVLNADPSQSKTTQLKSNAVKKYIQQRSKIQSKKLMTSHWDSWGSNIILRSRDANKSVKGQTSPMEGAYLEDHSSRPCSRNVASIKILVPQRVLSGNLVAFQVSRWARCPAYVL
jgi:hypothetical protein